MLTITALKNILLISSHIQLLCKKFLCSIPGSLVMHSLEFLFPNFQFPIFSLSLLIFCFLVYNSSLHLM